ncbi:MAG TPA: hypothetical protein VM925_06800 [Labilithrix sp.]|nr:hypothetical protein [Labilithrix sp.]
MSSKKTVRWSALPLLFAIRCKAPDAEDAPKFTMRAELTVTSDPGRRLANVDVLSGGVSLATTDEWGHASITLQGSEGDIVELDVSCPAGHQPPPPLRVALRRLSEGSPSPRFDARCAPIERTVVVGIRAENGKNLPIQHLGKVVARTDEAGVAHVVLQVKPNEQVTFQLDTQEGGRKSVLRPENPTLTFIAKDRDDFVVLDQRFEIERVVARVAPRPPGPQRL